MADENKSFLGLLNGITRYDYYGETDMTDDFLRQELYEELSPEEFQKLTGRLRGLIKSMAMTNMDVSQAEVFLTSQAKKKDANITDTQKKLLLKFWKNHRSKIHDALIDRCSWNDKLKNMSWRIDMTTQTRAHEQVMEPTAIVEVQLENRQSEDKKIEVLQFELDNQSLPKVLQTLKEIEEQLEKYSK